MSLVTSSLTDLATSDVVVGKPVELGGATFVPLSRISVGFGGGGGEGSGEGPAQQGKRKSRGRGRGVGGAAAGDAKVRPVAVIAFDADGVQIHHVADKKSSLEKRLDKIPERVERVEEMKHGKASEPLPLPSEDASDDEALD